MSRFVCLRVVKSENYTSSCSDWCWFEARIFQRRKAQHFAQTIVKSNNDCSWRMVLGKRCLSWWCDLNLGLVKRIWSTWDGAWYWNGCSGAYTSCYALEGQSCFFFSKLYAKNWCLNLKKSIWTPIKYETSHFYNITKCSKWATSHFRPYSLTC